LALRSSRIVGFAGAAIDYSRASAAKLQLQRAVDATALALVRDAPTASDGQLKARGKQLVKTLLKDAKGVSAHEIAVSRQARTIRVAASGAMRRPSWRSPASTC
jgi:Putative Flp pilus-assembly TadE/G-like